MQHVSTYNSHLQAKFHKQKRQRQNEQKQKWAKFTYIGKETKFITKLFKSTNVKIAFTTNNTIEKYLAVRQETPRANTISGVYQLTCPECKMKYTGQTGRPFRVRIQEHVRDFKCNNNRSKFAQHLIDNKHAIGNMEDIMEVVHMTKKGKKLDTLESFQIYKETKADNQINDKLTVRENEIFEITVQEDPYRGSTAPPQPNS